MEASDLEVREAFGHRSIARHMKFEGFQKESKRHAGLGWIQFADKEMAKTFPRERGDKDPRPCCSDIAL